MKQSPMKQPANKIQEYIVSIIIVFGVVTLSYYLQSFAGYRVVSLILLLEVSVLAFLFSTGPVLMAAALSALAWNFLFIPPHYTLHINTTEDVLMFFMFFIIALLNGVLTSQIKKREQQIRIKEKYSHTLFLLSKRLSEIMNKKELIEYLDTRIQGELDLNIKRENEKVFILSDDNDSAVEKEFLESCAELIAAKFERERLKEMAETAFVLKESDKLFKTLFNSISHEFRIPVTTIMGASDALLTNQYSAETQNELFKEINIASDRLNQLIENLLNMSRLETGKLTIRNGWYDIHDLIKRVSGTINPSLQDFKLNLHIQEDMPLVKFDFGLMEQVLHNLLLNASQHSPKGSEIDVNVRIINEKLIIEVADAGTGLKPGEFHHVFDKFYKADKTRTGNMGLGLSIVKGFVDAHNGTVTASNASSGGAVFKIEIPIDKSEFDSLPNK